ncbi:MAG TPA: complex I NDUFA9 subunit family protein, partial [Sphingomicrobium sp.]|nr:complex I NDUFA9 subunit family protein [Sphingomicrobium sp.]
TEILKAAGRDTDLIEVPNAVTSLISYLGFLPGAPLTRDQWLMLQEDNLPSAGSEGLEAFGIKATPFGAVAPEWLAMYGGNRFARRRVGLTANS